MFYQNSGKYLTGITDIPLKSLLWEIIEIFTQQ